MKRPGRPSLASQRELIELAKTMDLAEIVRKPDEHLPTS
jgi:hypothetical protein